MCDLLASRDVFSFSERHEIEKACERMITPLAMTAPMFLLSASGMTTKENDYRSCQMWRILRAGDLC
jgi:hypothetical protein